MNLSSNDIKFFENKGISLEVIKQQIEFISKGNIPTKLNSPIGLSNGITKIKDTDIPNLLNKYEEARKAGKIEKFVPASGAASRMFQCISYYLANFSNKSYEELLKIEDTDKEIENLLIVYVNLKQMPFYSNLLDYFNKNNLNLVTAIDNKNLKLIFSKIMDNDGLGYQDKPKGLIPFHKYQHTSHNAFFEHLADAVSYCADDTSTAKVHFTINDNFKDEITQNLNKLISEFTSYNLDITLSVQSESTNMIALTQENEIVRQTDGTPLLRPAGHGALLENLMLCKSDYLHLKNIDNVIPFQKNDDLIIHRKLMTGLLIELKEKINGYINSIENQTDFDRNLLNEFISTYFQIDTTLLELEAIKEILNRPIRVCAMVKNEGEPGGGPFYVERVGKKNNYYHKQIIELAQIDKSQVELFKQGTHFNPVDIVCSIKNYKNEIFDLHKFADKSMGIVSDKNYNGNKIKIGELPGLWNGSMADWLTVFVELPISTFNPVKTVVDLLREEHIV